MKSTTTLRRLGFLWLLAAQLDIGFFEPVVGLAHAFHIIPQPSARHGSSSLAYNVDTARRRRQCRAIDLGLQAGGEQGDESKNGGEEGDESKKETPPVDPVEQQRELNAIMAGEGSSTELWGGGNNDDDDESEVLYNAAPLFTGAVVTVGTLVLTGYLIYAGLTGDDPLAGHPNL
jgi:hypothetical protein